MNFCKKNQSGKKENYAKKKNLFTLIITMLVLFAHAIIMSTACASVVFIKPISMHVFLYSVNGYFLLHHWCSVNK